MWIAIVHFRAEFAPSTNKGSVQLQLQNGTTPVLNFETAEAFLAVMLLLREPNAAVNTQTGVIASGFAPVGS